MLWNSLPAWNRFQPGLELAPLAGNQNFQACLQPEMSRLLAGNRTIPSRKNATSNWKSPFSFWKYHYFQPEWCSLPAGNCFILAGSTTFLAGNWLFSCWIVHHFPARNVFSGWILSHFPARNHFFHAGFFSIPSQKSLFLPRFAVTHTKFNFYEQHSHLKSFVADTKTLSAFPNKRTLLCGLLCPEAVTQRPD